MPEVPKVPKKFLDGEQLSFRDINNNLRHYEKYTNASAARRYARSQAFIRFGDQGANITQATGQGNRSVVITPPHDVMIEFLRLRARSTSGTKDIGVSVTPITGSNVNPVITLTPVVGTEVTASANTAIILSANTQYRIEIDAVTSGDSFSCDVLDLEVHIKSDRYGGSVPATYSPNVLDSSNSDSAATINTETTAIAAAVADDVANEATPCVTFMEITNHYDNLLIHINKNRIYFPLVGDSTPAASQERFDSNITKAQFVYAADATTFTVGSHTVDLYLEDEVPTQLATYQINMTTPSAWVEYVSSLLTLSGGNTDLRRVVGDYIFRVSGGGLLSLVSSRAYMWLWHQ